MFRACLAIIQQHELYNRQKYDGRRAEDAQTTSQEVHNGPLIVAP
jgi:hypothetical protein